MSAWLRRHARVLGASVAMVLTVAVGYAVRSTGAAHAQPARAVAQSQVHAITPVLAPAAQRRRAHVRSSAVASSVSPRQRAAAARASAARAGAPAPTPTRRSESLALRQVAGLSLAQVTTQPVCARATPGHATCAAQRLVLRSTGAPVHPHVTPYDSLGSVSPAGAHPTDISSAAPPSAGTPAYLEQAYDLAALSQTGGAGDTVAIVDAYNDPTAGSDMATYRSTYGLPACTFSNGCFRKVGQTGTSSLPATTDPGWEQETSLDLDAVSAVCPLCHILLVEANSNSFSDLEAAMQTAAGTAGVKQISASWGGISSGVPGIFHTFSGIATVAATGDTGYVGPGEDVYPAALPDVTAAGGTSLAPAAAPNARGFGEGAWSWNGVSGGSSGCDLQFPRPSYQPAMGCAGRAYADVSADADPTTGLTVYNHGTWSLLGGTSLSTPLIAAYYAVTGLGSTTPQWAYSDSRALNDIVSGSTGNCAVTIAYICDAQAGYDGPTGVGSISGSVATGGPGIGGPSIPSPGGAPNTYTAGVSAHGATISAGIYRNGLDTTWSIQYGISTAYGSQTPAIDVGAGIAPVSVTGYLSQLAPGTTYHYRLVAQNSAGTTTGYDYTFTTAAPQTGQPTAAFAVSPSSPTPGGSVTFDGSSSIPPTGGSIDDYSWNFGDGTPPQDGETTQHTFTQRGMYTVTLTVTSNGQSDTTTQSVTVDNPPTAQLTPSATAVPADTTVAFNAGATTADTGGSIADYSWNFGDGTPTQDAGTTATAKHTFTTPGLYTVTLTATDDLNVSSTTTAQITVADFTASPSIPAPGNPVTLTAVNPGPAGSTYTWDFGDTSPPQPQTTTTPTTNYTYNASGSYSVTLTITSSDGTTSSTTTGAVNVDTAPTAAFIAIPSAVAPGKPVSFDASGSSAADGNPMADYSWNFGDGTPAQDAGTTATTSHKFMTPGIYTVTLTTTDDLGGTATISRPVIVDQPTAAFMLSPAAPAPNAAVSFDASMASDPESNITDYSWNFGDGTPGKDAGTNAITSHTFTNPGTYTVTLTVTDQFGFTNATSQQVVVAPASSQSTGGGTTTTTTTPTPTPAPVATPTPAPPAAPPVSTNAGPPPLVVRLSVAGRQHLAAALSHGLHLALTVNQGTRGSVQISIPLSETRQGAGRAGNPNATVVLLRSTRNIATGTHTIGLKLSRAAARHLASSGPLVLTVRITLIGANGKPVTRTTKITLTR